MHIGITWWVFYQRDLTGKDLSQHCFEGSTYKLVCAWQVSSAEFVLLPCKCHNATPADGHQRRRARETLHALSWEC